MQYPIGNRVPATHVGLHQAVDHESRRHMDTVLAGVFAVPLALPVQIANREGLGKFGTAVAFDPRDNVIRSGVEIWTAAVVVELEFLSMCSHCRHDRLRGFLPALEG